MIYQEFQPPAALAPFVHCLWRFQHSEATSSEVIVPDGRPELILNVGKPYYERQTGHQQPRILFAGQLTEPLELWSSEGVDFWAVRFRPDGARGFLGRPVSDVTNQRLDLGQPGNRELQDLAARLRLKTDQAGAIGDICSTLIKRIGSSQPDPLVRAVMDAVVDGSEPEPRIALSDRQFQRRFKNEVGVSLRTLKAIRRFRSVFDRMQDAGEESWVERALATGYFDQPQLARDFKRFLGRSARAWIRETGALSGSLGATPG